MKALELGRLVSPVEIGFTELTVILAIFEHVIDGFCELVGYGGYGTFGSAPGFEAMKLVFVIGALLLYGCPGDLPPKN